MTTARAARRAHATTAAASLATAAACAGVVALAATRHTAAPSPAAPTYEHDIAPIVAARCVSCHHEGGSAPFALATFEQVRRRGETIRAVVARRYMPPWLPAQGEETFVGARRLSEEERQALDTWVLAGMPRGEPAADAGVAPVQGPARPSGGLEAPDLEVTLDTPYLLPADGPDVYRSFVFPVELDEVRYVRAVEIRPGNLRVAHHASLGLDRGGSARHLEALDEAPGFDGVWAGLGQSPPGHFVGWAPGKGPVVSPEGLAWRLDPGRDLVLQLHMVPSGRPERVTPSVAVRFASEPPSARAVLLRLGSTRLDIPAGEAAYEATDRFVLPVGVRLLAVSPHAHYLTREILVVARGRDRRETTLIHVPAWDFRWQEDYRYREPVVLPAGTELLATLRFDNSTGNVANPHVPPRRVVYGPATTDEMGDVWLQVLPASAADARRLEGEVAEREARAQVDGYRLLVGAQPRVALHRVTLGTLLLGLGRLDEALGELRRAVAIDGSLALAQYGLGVAAQRAGRLDEAGRALSRALALEPRYAEAAHALGHVALAAGNALDAGRRFEQAVALRPGFADGWNSLGTLRAGGRDVDGALAALERAIAAEPDHREALNNLAILLANRGDARRAVALLERAVEAHPDDEASRANLAVARSMAGQRR
ncbi:MAG: tetratricopeptide repeat protein [Acidobacteria bacterium]|nr:tetratricopeptide repeat protein [Acidobacteriota bacterium]